MVRGAPIDRRRRLGLVACHASMFSVALALNLMPLLLPLLRRGVAPGVVLTNEQLGRIAAMIFAGTSAGLLCSGPWVNRCGARLFTVGGNLILALGLVALARANSYLGILVAAILMGFGGGVLDLILSPIVCALVPERRAQAMNWLHSFFCIGSFLVVLATTLAFGRSFTWHQVAALMAGPPAALAVAMAFVPHPSLTSPAMRRTRVGDLVREPYFLLALATIFLAGAVEMGIVQWLPAYAELELRMSRSMGGYCLLALSVAMALGRMGAGILSGRFPIQRVMALCSAVAAVLILFAGLTPSPVLSLGALILSGVAMGCLWPSTLGLAADRFPWAGASMFGVLSAVGNVGGILMPWAVGVVGDASRIGVGIGATAVCPFLVLVALRMMGRIPAMAARNSVA
jgi:fucose permease